ncbi:family 1 glycosylhydrolase [Novosphingobium lentum]|uniref:family 1 glycosylhydrolase n=1 Tax=Novosphingobium lentum TaxID=145287 RepID=UPI0008326D12|nr:family 1 glycosylhydrolase [Novosphingobium lentum]
MIDRRSLLAGSMALAATPAAAKVAKLSGRAPDPAFPKGFMWGAATAGHQVEGNNTNSDCWLLENIKPTLFAEPSRDAANSFELWATDLDLAKAMGLNAYRFSLEWARIEPEQGLFSLAMLDHYKRMIAGCRERRLTPVVTFNHYSAPIWFAAMGGWTNPRSPDLFARYCERAARALAADIGYATTLNEPNIMNILRVVLPPQVISAQRAMLEAAAQAVGTAKFAAGNAIDIDDIDTATVHLLAGHKAGRNAIKAVRPDLPVGVSLSMFDDQAAGKGSIRDAMRAKLYGPWLEAVRGDDFLGVQNYERQVWTATGKLPTPPGVPVNYSGSEVYPASLANAVRYAHAATGVPIFVTEHGVGTSDDTVRANLIPAALTELKRTMDTGVPVIGYMHWSLIDNFEWIFGYKVKFGLHSFDPVTFARTPKPSAAIYGAIARRNAV